MGSQRGKWGLILILVATLALSACAARVVMTGYENSPETKLRAGVAVRTAPGVGYSDLAEKTVNISIYAPDLEPRVYLFTGQYKFVAAHIEWNIVWIDDDRARIELYGFPPGVFPPSGDTAKSANIKEVSAATRIATFEYARKPGSKSFEQLK